MRKLNANEATAYTTTLVQEQNEALFHRLENLAYDTMEACGVPETDLDQDVHIDFMWGILEKFVYRASTGEWPDASFGDEIESSIDMMRGHSTGWVSELLARHPHLKK